MDDQHRVNGASKWYAWDVLMVFQGPGFQGPGAAASSDPGSEGVGRELPGERAW
jgi:hypothetical protein